MRSTTIPKHLDEPERMLFWTIDEFMALMLPILFGFAIEVMWLGLVLSPLCCGLLMKTKKQGYPGLWLSYSYWHLPNKVVPLKRFPSSHQRQWMG